MTALAFVTAVLLSAASKPSQYPLAAALVLDGKLAIVDLPTHSLRPLPLPEGLIPDQADLSLDKTRVVVSATRGRGMPHRLFLVDVASGDVQEMPVPGQSDLEDPRFADGGASVLFAAPARPGQESHDNRTRLYRFRLKGRELSEVQTDHALCGLSPVAFRRKVAFIETSCFVRFALELVDPKSHHEQKIADLAGLSSEVAVSLDGKKLLYTAMERDGYKFYLYREGEAPRLLLSTGRDAPRLQPRFVCPRDVLFVNQHKVWALNSDSGELTEVLDVASLDPATGKDEVAHVAR